jgi:hypothetical protein
MTRITSRTRPTTRRAFTAALSAFILPVLLSGCSAAPADDVVRYRMTVEVDTPQGVRTGSAVRELRYNANSSGWFPLGESRPSMKVKGEAVAVDIAPGQVLFALLSSARGDVDYAQHVPRIAFPQCMEGRDKLTPQAQADCKDLKWQAKQLVEFWPTLPPQKWQGADIPMLVRFKDLADPKSVEAVDPDALEKSFGPGTKLRRITVQVTDDAVTTGIGKRLGWLGEYPESRLDRDYKGSTNPNIAQQLSNGEFRQGVR